jgi:hypothetical protein
MAQTEKALLWGQLNHCDLDRQTFPTSATAIPGYSIDPCCARTIASARVRLRKSAHSVRVFEPDLQTRLALLAASQPAFRWPSSSFLNCGALLLFPVGTMIHPLTVPLQNRS